jgi:hypothetical protein
MEVILKRHTTIGCCGIDCGLCPRFHTDSISACPGCGGLNFREKHPSCGFITCCVVKQGLEVCSDCKDYPCRRFEPEQKGYDSFVTHKKVFTNLDFIKGNGIDCFLNLQRQHIDLLIGFLGKYNDGRSKSFFCIGCTMLPLDKLQELHGFMNNYTDNSDIKEKAKILKDRMQEMAGSLKIDLKLNTKK